ncbi:MAG: hypothetical protein RL760_1351 [Candidatus Eisenbacteria bacterium]
MNLWQPTLHGTRITLRPIVAEDFEALFAAASDPGIWAQHPDPLRWRRDRFEPYFAGALESGGGLTVIDNTSGAVVGSSRFYDWRPDERTVVIGYTFITRDHWGTGTNTEMKALMLAHAFRHADAVFFHVGPQNLRSQRAVDKLGARFVQVEDVLVGGVVSPRRVYRLDAPRTV